MNKKEARALKRIRSSKQNATVALTTSILMGVFSFIERMIFNQFFIEDYLGLYSFNYNIYNIIAFLELGLYGSISYALYAPLEYDDKDQIIAIMRFFKKAYFIIGTAANLVTVGLVPFLPYLLKTSIDIKQASVYFLLFLIGTNSNYYLTYRNILINANQEQYKITFVTNMTWAVLYCIEIIIAITTQNFLYYSIAIAAAQIAKNLILNIIGRREFPYLKSKKKVKMNPEVMQKIKRNTKGMIINRLGTMMVNSTDSLLISAMVGTALLGKYSNYQMMTLGLLSISYLLPQSITASIGNAGVTESKRTMSRSFEVLDLSSYFIYATLTILLLNVMTPIVSTFFGASRVLDFSTTILIAFNFYLQSMREILLSYKGSLGLYWDDRKRPILEGLTNLVTSIILGKFWGLNGIILGTIITAVAVNLTIEPRVIFHNGFSRSAVWFYISTVLRFLLVVILAFLTSWINSLINYREIITANLHFVGITIELGSLIQIIMNSVVSLVITIIAFYLIFHKTESVKSIINTLKILNKNRKARKESND